MRPGVEHLVEHGSELVILDTAEDAALGRRAQRRGQPEAVVGRLTLGRGRTASGLTTRPLLLDRLGAGWADYDVVAALLATDLDALRANLVVANHVLRAAAIADETHRSPQLSEKTAENPPES
ncbi:Hypothetical protein AA314_04038 [Archangium gephyra]|uniref:Uncharacterized protein n=1 Tax=Archangium gephyra TaxID=48 RepID=A0AAC8TE08_9BACT|nr:Hypothetical protein AA314_04038 [Archangium gephyra]